MTKIKEYGSEDYKSMLRNIEEYGSEEYKRILKDIEKLDSTEQFGITKIIEEKVFNEAVASKLEIYETYKRPVDLVIFQEWLTRTRQVDVSIGRPIVEKRYMVGTYIDITRKVVG